MKQRSKKLLGILLSLALVLGLLPGMSLAAYANDAPPYAQYKNTTTEITFDGKSWYLINYDDTTVTLLAKECVGASAFGSNNTYSGSTIETAVNNYYKESISTNVKTAVNGEMFLLTIDQATLVYTDNPNVLKCSQASGALNNTWWLSSPGSDNYGRVVNGNTGTILDGDLSVGATLGVRPALQLDLSKVTFDSESKTFSLPTPYPLWVGGTQVTSANAGNIDGNNKASYDAASRTLTLNGYSYTGVGYKMGSTDEACAAIYWSDSDNPLTIQLSGTNSIVRTGTSGIKYGDSAYYGIYSPGDIIIKGPATASLSVDGGDTESQDRKISYGIYAKTTIQDVQVTASGTSTGISRLSAIQRANVTATGGSYGISSYTLEISENSTVTATGGRSAIDRSGPPECVKNAIPGTGWTNTEGTEGKTTIAVSTEGQDISSYKKVQFPEAAAAAATVTTAPTAKTLTYNGEAQELVTAGKAEGGTMQYYVVSADAKPDWSADIPTGTEPGNYTVWYMAKGDADHSDSEAKYVTAKITASGTAEATFDLNTGSEEHQDVEIPLEDMDVYSVSGDVEITADDYTVGNDTLTFKKDYLSKLAVGDHGFTVSGYVVGTDTEAELAVTIKVVDTTPSATPDYYYTETYYKVILAETENGKATASRSTAPKGATVTVTATPDEGFVLDAITAKDAKGNDVTVTDGKFTMPASDVTVTVTFKAAESEPGFATCDHGDGCILNDFSDLDPDAWYHDGVHYVLETGLMEGYGDGTFRPNDFASRAMAITLIWNMEGKPVVNFALPYSDVAQGKWYTEAIRWATSEGIVEGWTDEATGKKVFAPDADVTREQFAAMLYRYAQLHGEGFTGMWMFRLGFTDAADVSDWADEAMHWMVMQGVINGMDGKLNPQGKATRAMLATMVQRFVLGA